MPKTFPHSTRCKVNVLLSTAIILIFGMPLLVRGQGSTPDRGFQPGGSYALSDIESINTDNGNLMMNLALGKLAPGGFFQDFAYLTGTLTYYTFDGTHLRLEVQHDSDNNVWINWDARSSSNIRASAMEKLSTCRA